MTDPEAAEADLLEQEGAELLEEPELGIEVPEADALEQARTDAPAAHLTPATLRDDVPEADALEQAYEVELDDDYDR